MDDFLNKDMATDTVRTQCATCVKERGIAKCAGCLKNFCLIHLNEHRQLLTKQFDEIETSRDLFRQTLLQQTTEPQQHPLIQQVNQWEQESITKIRQVAEETKLLVGTYINEHVVEIEEKLEKLTDQLRESREMDDIIETDLDTWKEELAQLAEQFNKPSHITFERRPTPLIHAIDVIRATEATTLASIFESKTL